MNDVLHVWIYPPGAARPVPCGVLELVQGRRCLFNYDASWLAHPRAFPLSPDMPLHAGVIAPPSGLDLHPVFEDAGPDRWGKNVINKVFNPQRRSPLEYLELAGEDRIGALGFSRSGAEYLVPEEQAFSVADLDELMRAAEALANQLPIDDDLRRLLRPGASAGGARPKAVIRHDGEAWIAKFPAEGDEMDVCAVEYASLRLAQSCGVDVPESRLVQVGGRNVLLVKRFDREQGSRLHYTSARTMLIAEGLGEQEMGYADLADLARRHSVAPKEDCRQLFLRMAFNVMIENTDDHDKNHAFLCKAGEWRLSPAYDIQPQVQGLGYHQLRIGLDGHVPSIANVLSECTRFLLKKREAEEIVADLAERVGVWKKVFTESGVSERDIAQCGRYILRSALE